jgi:hypothetical protein
MTVTIPIWLAMLLAFAIILDSALGIYLVFSNWRRDRAAAQIWKPRH